MRSPDEHFPGWKEKEAAMATWAETSRKAGPVTFTACSLDGKPFELMLESVRVPFEPSCYQGDGTETRLTICFSGADEELRRQLLAMEESVGATCSCLKDDLVKAKVNIDKVRCYNANKARIETPKSMRGWSVCARLHLRGSWATRQGSGLSLEATDLQFLQEASEPPCPF